MSVVIDVSRIPDSGMDLAGEESFSSIELPVEIDATAKGPVKYSFHAFPVSEELIVRGRISVEIVFKCSRCAENFDFELIDAGFERSYQLDDDLECVDLTPDMRETIILAFPSYPVCRDDCSGLCSTCGIDLNKGSCDCKPPTDNRWNVLSDLGVE